jgi:hypothetical protein
MPEPLPNRTMWVSEDVCEWVEPPFGPDHDEERLWRFRGTLDAFTNYRRITVSEKPRDKAGNTFLSRVDPVKAEFWGIRTLQPPEGIRCFGCFADVDVFIALTWNYREAIEDFDDAVADCMQTWEKFFAPLTPHRGDTLDAYLTNFQPL